jgi:hypothetical protein
MSKLAAAVVVCLGASALAGSPIDDVKHKFEELQATKERIVPVPMHQYSARDCWTKAHLSVKSDAASLLQQGNVPGAGVDGIDKFKPFETVLKDGFLELSCVKDYMYYRGDKFGDNKHDYKLGSVSDVSIVHYDAFVAKEDRAEMTQKKCFEFCRTVPNMGFFGIVNGRGCYCTPYVKPMESDSSQCDAVCEGDKTLMCGGKAKSSIFAMHMCDSTEEDLSTRVGRAVGVMRELGGQHNVASGLSKQMQNEAEKLQKSFGAVGDSAATGHMQAAKVFAGDLVHTAEDAGTIADKLNDLAKSASSLKGFTDPETVTKAERIMEDMDETVAAGEAKSDELGKLISLATSDSEDIKAKKQYYPVMYFVDKEFENVPTTCTGDRVGKPIVGESASGCAAKCDDNIHSCVGFQYFEDGKDTLCFLLSGFSTGSYYTGCGKSFLQTSAAPYEATCFAKLSKFEGTTLKPNPSGKCAQCFKELTKADRCYK